MPLVVPSWLTPEARTTAWMWSPSRSASASRLSTIAPAPSPGTNPSAPASKLRQRPDAESIPATEADL